VFNIYPTHIMGIRPYCMETSL